MPKPFRHSLFNKEELSWIKEARLLVKKAIHSATLRGYSSPIGIHAFQWGAITSVKEGLDYLVRKDQPNASEESPTEGNRHEEDVPRSGSKESG